jgi:hypothetical protein
MHIACALSAYGHPSAVDIVALIIGGALCPAIAV